MQKTRELTVQERGALICALAEARTRDYEKAADFREAARQLEDGGKTGYLSLENEAEDYERLADLHDILLELVTLDRIFVAVKEDCGLNV